MNKIKKIISIAIVAILIGGNVSYASNSSVIQNESPIIISESTNESSSNSIIPKNNIIQGGGSLDKAEKYVETKLFDVVGFLQSFIKPLTYVTFIISTILVLFGVITDSKSKFKGFLGMAFSVFVYVSVVFAPQIVDYFSSWLAM